MIRAIVGANWGDEGKGKITDALAKDADVVVRFQGGSNAGHTIVNQYGRFALHQLPSGVFYDHTTNIIGNGVALDLGKFLKETESLAAAGVKPTMSFLTSTGRPGWRGSPSAPPSPASPRSIPTSTPRPASSSASCMTRTTAWRSWSGCWRPKM